MAPRSDSAIDRRIFLGGLAATLVPAGYGRADERRVAALIAQAQGLSPVSRRITVISQGLLGTLYGANTLIGGPRQPEQFVLRDDRFDCVTFCETVLAAADAHDLQSFEAALRAIRYRNGAIEWRERNHDWAAWCERNVANGFCRPLTLGTPVVVKKTLDWPRQLGRRSYTITATTPAALLAQKASLQDGDIIGFVSRRPILDFFHTGFVMAGGKGEVMLRSASESHGRVIDERMQDFLRVNGVRYVTLLRPQDREGKRT